METVVFGSRQAKQLLAVRQQQHHHQQQLQDSRSPLSPFATIPNTISSVVAPNFSYPPFFSIVSFIGPSRLALFCLHHANQPERASSWTDHRG